MSVGSARDMSDVVASHSMHAAGTGGGRMGMAGRGRRPRGEASGPLRGSMLSGDADRPRKPEPGRADPNLPAPGDHCGSEGCGAN